MCLEELLQVEKLVQQIDNPEVTNTGIQTPNGKICMGTGFGVYSIGNGNTIYDDSMYLINGGETQEF